jgi:hypothetical protein
MVEWCFVMWTLQLMLWGGEVFSTETRAMAATPMIVPVAFLLVGITVVIWTSVVGIKMLSEVHGFSSWRALGVGLFMATPFIAVALLLVGLAVTLRR